MRIIEVTTDMGKKGYGFPSNAIEGAVKVIGNLAKQPTMNTTVSCQLA